MLIKKLTTLAIMGLAASIIACGDGGKKNQDADTDAEDDADTDAEDDVDIDADDDPADDTLTDVDPDSEDPCPSGQAWNPYSTPPGCVTCARDCTLEGETGEAWPITARSGDCVCTTEDDYYFSLSGAGVSHACDEDGDGWVNLSAKPNIESTDEAIAANARCHLREVDTFVLLAEGEDPATDGCAVLLADTDLGVASLELYEADERDDQFLLDEDTYAPVYGGRKMRAEELNSLTKGCMNAIGDFNANGIADVNDWDLGGDPIYAFSYYLELHRGWYEDGKYYIQEKSRLSDAAAGWGTPLTYNDDGYWRECVRKTDSDFVPTNAIGTDFARYNGGTLDAEMLHHSQFKCIQIVETNDDPVAFPQKLPLTELEAVPRRYVLNMCSAEDETAGPVTGTVNPSDAVLTCELDTTPALDEVGFVSVKYIHYDGSTTFYERGCVNGCIDDPPTCPTAATCEPDVNDYGRPECVCPNHWSGTDCDVCPPHWDPSTDCSACFNMYDPTSDCTACIPSYDITTDCTDCLPNWDISTSCTTCINNYDVLTGCTDCLYHYDLSTACTVCETNWDPVTSCSTCMWNWDPATSCTTCDSGMAFTTSSDCRRTANLLTNPGAESGMTGWAVWTGALTSAGTGCYGSIPPHTGSRRFNVCECCTNGYEARAYQDVDVTSYAAGIALGRYSLERSGWLAAAYGDAGYWVQCLDSGDAVITSTPEIEVVEVSGWSFSSSSLAIPAGTQTLRFWLDSDERSFDATDCKWDDLSLVLYE
ncbi:MAG: hypothetical protein JRG91_13845 [Deltaproteobacteria bacterium]|nr:hypothetical protein [Deltaproteobacteria bacterium]